MSEEPVSNGRLLARIDRLEERIADIMEHGSPQLRERMAKIETQLDTLMDPEHGIYSRIGESTNKLKGWAIAALTAVGLLLASIIAHIISSGQP